MSYASTARASLADDREQEAALHVQSAEWRALEKGLGHIELAQGFVGRAACLQAHRPTHAHLRGKLEQVCIHGEVDGLCVHSERFDDRAPIVGEPTESPECDHTRPWIDRAVGLRHGQQFEQGSMRGSRVDLHQIERLLDSINGVNQSRDFRNRATVSICHAGNLSRPVNGHRSSYRAESPRNPCKETKP